MLIAEETKKYNLLPMGLLFNLDCFASDISEQRQRLNPIIDFDDWCVSKLKSLVIKEYYLELLKGVVKPIIMFQPHNFPQVNYLNLAESYFIRFQDQRDQRLRVSSPCRYVKELYSEYKETCARKIVNELVTRIDEMHCGLSSLMKNFLKFARISRCIRKDEMISIIKSCLNAMYRQEQVCGSDGNLTVEILMTLCVLQEHKENLMSGDYSFNLIDYVLRCCTAAKFDVEKYFLYDDGGRHTHFCPLTTCIISSPLDIRKLRVLLQHGFELQALNLSLMKFMYIFVGMNNHLQDNVLRTAHSELRISDRRHYIVLLFLFMVLSSFTHRQWGWADCSKLLFNSIPDAYICELEVCSFLKIPYLRENYVNILSLCTLFKGSYVASRAPRTLKHLSRCVVRKVLKNNFQLPNGIETLVLPRTLEFYLKYLED